jgi:hypothetical protein
VPERLHRSAQTRQDVFGWIQENQRISLVTIEPLAKGSALVGPEFFDAFLDFSQTALATMLVRFHFNQSVDCRLAPRIFDVNQVIDYFFCRD